MRWRAVTRAAMPAADGFQFYSNIRAGSRIATPASANRRGDMSAHGWLIVIASVDAVVAAGTPILVMVLRRWSGAYFMTGLAAGMVLILSLVILGRALGLL